MNTTLSDRLIGGLLVLVALMVILGEWHLVGNFGPLLPVLMTALTLLMALRVAPGRLAFVAVAVLLTVALILLVDDWRTHAMNGLRTASFIAAFYCALATLRSAAERDGSMRAAGRFLAQQPPGRRYLALTAGGQMFALVLNYGSIALLGALATASAREEPDVEIRNHRTRRMLLAIQRAFVSTLPWSPLSFAVAITTSVVPGTSWGTVLIPGLGTSVLLAGTGWALDTLFKPRLSHPAPPRRTPEGTWALMLPLLVLLLVLGLGITVLELLTGFRIVGIVLVVVPAMAVAWTARQARQGGKPLAARLADFAFRELPGYRSEVILLMMAGYIGTVGAPLLVPVMQSSGFHPETLPTWLVLVSFVWLIPAAGQIGMNPILAISLIAPLIPPASALGVTPSAIVGAITAGWALSGASSPFTATTLLIGSFGNVSARHVGLRWNGLYMIVSLVLLSAWVLVYARLTA